MLISTRYILCTAKAGWEREEQDSGTVKCDYFSIKTQVKLCFLNNLPPYPHRRG